MSLLLNSTISLIGNLVICKKSAVHVVGSSVCLAHFNVRLQQKQLGTDKKEQMVMGLKLRALSF